MGCNNAARKHEKDKFELCFAIFENYLSCLIKKIYSLSIMIINIYSENNFF